MGGTAPHETRVARAERLAGQERSRALREAQAAKRQEALARSAPDPLSVMHARTADLHRAARRLHEEAAALHATHADHERASSGGGSHLDWYAEERERVANERDRTADERERLADERDEDADERERVADERERIADERDQRLRTVGNGLMSEPGTEEITRSRATLDRAAAAIRRSEERIARAAARTVGEQAGVDRETAASDRNLD